MNAPDPSVDSRPTLALGIGVTGARHLDPDQMSALRPPVTRLLATLRDHVDRLAAGAPASRAYAASTSPLLRVISPLAEGADRLVAEEACALGYRLTAPLPFALQDYERDFAPASLAAFRNLAATAQLFALDGARGADESASYEAVGRFVVRNCDLLVALWDGRPARGRGGTAEIVRFAMDTRVPVWWIDLAGESRLVLYARELHGEGARVEGLEAALLAYVDRIVLPPEVPKPCRCSQIHPPFRPRMRPAWRDEAPLRVRVDEIVPPSAKADAWWQEHHTRAEAAAMVYGRRTEVVRVLILVLSVLAMALAAFGSRTQVTPWLVMAAELLLLLAAGGLSAVDRARRWQARWSACRRLAELCRGQSVLAPLGWTLPCIEAARAAVVGADRRVPSDYEAWVDWYALALHRAAPLPEGNGAAAAEAALLAARKVVARRREDRARRRWRVRRAERHLAALGWGRFLLGSIGSVLGLALIEAGRDLGEAIESVALLLAGGAAGLIGLRAWSRPGPGIRRSRGSRARSAAIIDALDAIDLAAPLASQRLGAALHRLAMATAPGATACVKRCPAGGSAPPRDSTF